MFFNYFQKVCQLMLNRKGQKYSPGSCIVKVHLSSMKKFRERKQQICRVETALVDVT